MICAITNCRSITTSFLLLKKQQGTEVHFHIATAHTTMVSCHISAKDPDPLNLNLIQARVQEIILKNMDFGTTKTPQIQCIARSASHVAYYIYKYLQCFYNHRPASRDIFFCQIMIATINFSCTPHCNKKDVLNSKQTDNIIKKLQKVKSHNEYFEIWRKIGCVIDNLQFWGVCVPTTCCWQIVCTSPSNQVNVIQYFCLPNFGLCFRIKNYWVHCFLAGLFYHYTSVVIFVVDGLVYIRSHDDAEVFAWGAGSANETTTAKNLLEQKQKHLDQPNLTVLSIIIASIVEKK